MTELAGLEVPVPLVSSLPSPRWCNSRFSILNSSCHLDGCELLVLFQVKKSVKPLLGAISKKSLSKDKILHLQEPLQDDGVRTQAAPSPSAAAPGILLFSLSFVDSLLSVVFQARATSGVRSTRTSLGSVILSTICLSPGIGGVLNTSIDGLALTRLSADP